MLRAFLQVRSRHEKVPTVGRLELRWIRDDQRRIFMEVPMLVLSRKLNEKIVIDGNITITVVKIDRNQVRLGIEAPGQVPVYREEILPIALKEARDAQALAVCS